MARKAKKEVSGKTESPEVAVSATVAESAKPVSRELKKVIVTPEQLAKLQEEKRLVGYDPLTCEATII